MRGLTDWNVDENFWKLYPDFKVALSFKDIYKSDKSRNKEHSSKLMWYTALILDANSRFKSLPKEERIEIISNDYMGDKNYYKANKEKLDRLEEDYLKIMDTPAQKQLRAWEEKAIERAEFITKIPYDLNTFEDLDKMAINTPKIYDTLKTIRESLAQEEGEGNLKGGAMESLSD